MFTKKILFVVFVVLLFSSCSAYKKQLNFPPSSDIFITTGDGDIQKPYEPIGMLIYIDQGYYLPLPILGLIPIKVVDPDIALRTAVASRVKEMGGDALINLSIVWQPPKGGIHAFFGLGFGGSVAIYGTVIKR